MSIASKNCELFRRVFHMTRADLAAEIGYTQAQVNNYENEITEPPESFYEAVSRYFNLDLYLLKTLNAKDALKEIMSGGNTYAGSGGKTNSALVEIIENQSRHISDQTKTIKQLSRMLAESEQAATNSDEDGIFKARAAG